VARSEVKSDAMAGAWLCNHPEWQVCLNCAGAEKGQVVELEMLCQHGPDARCTNCIPDEEKVEGRKHLTFGEFMKKKRDRCEHAFNAVCINCMPPSEICYKMKEKCDKHKPWPLGLCNDCQPPPATLQRQNYRHVDYVEFRNFEAFSSFAALWERNGRCIQRAGLLYGKFAPDPNYPEGRKAVVEAIYEPPQRGSMEGVELYEDPREKHVQRCAEELGMCRVGWIFTHLPREFPVSSAEVRQMARFQNGHPSPYGPGSCFVTLVLTQNKMGEVTPSAFMASDQAMALERCDVLAHSDDPEWCEVRIAGKKEKPLPVVLKNDAKTGAKPVTRFEPEFLLVQLGCGRPIQVAGTCPVLPFFAHNTFPAEHRENLGGGDAEIQSHAAVKQHLRRYQDEPYEIRMSDFHLLMYLPQLFDLATALVLIAAVRERQPLEDGLKVILDALIEARSS